MEQGRISSLGAKFTRLFAARKTWLRTGRALVVSRGNATVVYARKLKQAWDYTKVSTWKNHRELERALASLPRRQRELDAFSEAIGQGFLELASSLENMTEVSGQIVPEGERLLSLSNGVFDGEAVLESAANLLSPVFGFLDECCQRQTEIAKRLEFCRSSIRELLTLQNSLSGVLQPLNYIETLFKIECAVLPDSVQSLFVSVTAEISQLEKKVEAMFAEKFAALTTIERALSDVLEKLGASLPNLSRLVSHGRGQIEATLTTLSEQVGQNAQRHGRLLSRTRQISDRVNAIVTALQAHDIVSQKIGHIVRELDEFASKELPLRSVFTRRERLRLTDELARVQTRQLEAVSQEAIEGERKIFQSVDAVVAAVNAEHDGKTALAEYRSVITGSEAMISGLLASIQSVGTMMSTTLDDAELVFHSVASIGQSADALTATIMELSVSMHFIALNAQIQAVQIGAGTGLEMLSARTAELSSETSTLSGQARQGLERVARVMKEIIDDFSLLRSEGAHQRESLQRSGSELSAKLKSLGSVSRAGYQIIEEATTGIQDQCKAMLDALPSEQAIIQQLAPTTSFLAKLCDLTSVDGMGEARELSAQERKELKSKYTMESERVAHERAINGQVAVIDAALTDAADKIELFVDSTPPTPPLESVSATCEGSIELF